VPPTPTLPVSARSVRQEDGQRCVGQDVAGCSPEDQLPQAALCVGSLNQEIAILRCGFCC
jgi:hypothetical protein